MKTTYFSKLNGIAARLLLILGLFVASLGAFSCESSADIQNDIESLKEDRISLQQDIQALTIQKRNLNFELKDSYSTIREAQSLKSNSTYVLVIQIKQSRLSLDIGKHIKDAMNKIEIAVPVDYNYYSSVDIGDKLSGDFRVGSFLVNGDIGSWNVKIKDKRILNSSISLNNKDNMYRFYSNPNADGRVAVVGSLEGRQLKMAVARCSKKDNFMKKKGRSIAEGRLAKGGDSLYGIVDIESDNLPSDQFIEIAQTVVDVVMIDPSNVTIATRQRKEAEKQLKEEIDV